MRSVDQCPACRACLTGARIPQEYIDRGFYGAASTHYQRTISICENDRHVCWQCPDCGHQWKGFVVSPPSSNASNGDPK